MSQPLAFFVTCPKNLEGLLEQELIELGTRSTKQTIAGVKFSGSLATAYRICLWSRLANRVLFPLIECNASNAESLYEGTKKINWLNHIHPTNSLVIDFNGTSATIKNSHFGALKVKDAIVDQIRTRTGKRPDINKTNPDIRINVYLYNNVATISLDLSGDSLHKRGYRSESGTAPLKENLAAALLYRSKWLDFAQQNKPLLDPMCGSGTILIEAAMMMLNYAPGLLRKQFGFTKWLNHDKKTWENLILEAKERFNTSLKQNHAEVRGYDTSPKMAGVARRNIEQANLTNFIDVSVKAVDKFTPPTHHGNQYGLIVTNPPYGERLLNEQDLAAFYSEFGAVLRDRFSGWEMAMLLGNPQLGKNLKIHSHKQYSFFNGSISCKLLMFHLNKDNFYRQRESKKDVQHRF